MIKDFVTLLTNAFNKTENSNLSRIFVVADQHITEVSDSLRKVELWRDIDNAEGTTLDLIGDSYNQARGLTDDSTYRVLIRGKVARDLSDGTFNSILNAIAVTLNCDPKDIELKTSLEDGGDEPATIVVTKAPLETIVGSGLSATQFAQLVQSISPGGVRVAYVSLEGTFRFSKDDKIEVSDKGFSDDGGITGGTLGEILMQDDDFKLPL